jgi:hypothetical protein
MPFTRRDLRFNAVPWNETYWLETSKMMMNPTTRSPTRSPTIVPTAHPTTMAPSNSPTTFTTKSPSSFPTTAPTTDSPTIIDSPTSSEAYTPIPTGSFQTTAPSNVSCFCNDPSLFPTPEPSAGNVTMNIIQRDSSDLILDSKIVIGAGVAIFIGGFFCGASSYMRCAIRKMKKAPNTADGQPFSFPPADRNSNSSSGKVESSTILQSHRSDNQAGIVRQEFEKNQVDTGIHPNYSRTIPRVTSNPAQSQGNSTYSMII